MDYYPWVMGFSAFFGILWCWLNANSINKQVSIKKQQLDQDRTLLLCVLALIGAFIGSRIAYVLLHFEAYQLHPDVLIISWASGLDWIGAPIGAALFILPAIIRKPKTKWSDLALLTPLWTSLCLDCWYAVNFVPVYYSGPVGSAPWSVSLPGILGDVEQRLPIAAMGMIWTLLADLISYRVQGNDQSPTIRLAAVIFYQMIFCLIMSFIRIDSVVRIADIPSDRVFTLIYLISSGLILVILQRFSTLRRNRLQSIGNKPARRSM